MDRFNETADQSALILGDFSMEPHRKGPAQVQPPLPLGPASEGIKMPVQALTKHPSKNLYVIGITGTNGKTTVSHLIGEALKAEGLNVFVLGTLNSGNKDLSTPEANDILEFMNTHLAQGGTHFVMEVTSEGIDQGRISGIDFDIKILTNITQDHLDYHLTMENYRKSKMDFMMADEAYRIFPDDFETTQIQFNSNLLGAFNLLNIKAAATALRHMGIAEETIKKTLSSCTGPRGRMEKIDIGQPYLVLIDYAHTPDGLQKVLETAREIANSRKGFLHVLFGCGGNRDSSKRSQMGKIASEIADFCIITDDNPRQEDSLMIMADIQKGMSEDFDEYILLQNRRQAIEFAVSRCQDNDVLIIAGKGHETYQELKSETIHFDDREEVIRSIPLVRKELF